MGLRGTITWSRSAVRFFGVGGNKGGGIVRSIWALKSINGNSLRPDGGCDVMMMRA